MGLLDDAKDKAEEIKDDVQNKFHEEKGRMEERHDHAEEEKKREDELEDDEYTPEERDV